MTKQHKARNIRWAEALESGKYKQCQHTLTDAPGSYCCLGVGSRVAGMPRKGLIGEDLPAEQVQEYFGWTSTDPYITVNDMNTRASFQNDTYKRSFKQIAKGVRKMVAEAPDTD